MSVFKKLKKSNSYKLNNWGNEVIENQNFKAVQYVKYILYVWEISSLRVVSMLMLLYELTAGGKNTPW
jgi:hypothetical protein